MSDDARVWLQDTLHARVLHVFDEVCNLISDDERLLSIVAEGIGDGPFSLVVPPIPFADRIPASSPVTLGEGRLHLGQLEIDWRSARLWEARPDWPALREQREIVLAGMQDVVATLERNAPGDSLASLVTGRKEPLPALVEKLMQQLHEPTMALAAGLRSRDVITAREAAAQLVGLGTGLTPAGDDWLVGCILGSWILSDEDETDYLAQIVAEPLLARTTALSRAMIQASARGECSADWHGLFGALLASDADVLRRVSERIISRGHTSGADALAGFATVLGTTRRD
jgi:hypothetical protein